MTLNKESHDKIMTRVLQAIFADTEISPFLGFKGGTAVYLFYNLNRFSVDLDFDILDAAKVDLVFKKVKEILSFYGELKNADNKSKGLFFNLAYEDKRPGDDNVKLDFSKKDFGLQSRYEVKEFMGVSVNVMVREDIVANKFAAVYQRGEDTDRDIFDMWFFLKKGWSVNKELLKDRTGLEYKEFLQKIIVMLEGQKDRNFLAGLGELLKNDEQKKWVKTQMRDETIVLLRGELGVEEKNGK